MLQGDQKFTGTRVDKETTARLGVRVGGRGAVRPDAAALGGFWPAASLVSCLTPPQQLPPALCPFARSAPSSRGQEGKGGMEGGPTQIIPISLALPDCPPPEPIHGGAGEAREQLSGWAGAELDRRTGCSRSLLCEPGVTPSPGQAGDLAWCLHPQQLAKEGQEEGGVLGTGQEQAQEEAVYKAVCEPCLTGAWQLPGPHMVKSALTKALAPRGTQEQDGGGDWGWWLGVISREISGDSSLPGKGAP